MSADEQIPLLLDAPAEAAPVVVAEAPAVEVEEAEADREERAKFFRRMQRERKAADRNAVEWAYCGIRAYHRSRNATSYWVTCFECRQLLVYDGQKRECVKLEASR